MGTLVNKLMEASMALLQATPDQQMNIVVLNKALFYLDLAALRDLGHVVTGQKYFALPMGPVLDRYERRIIRDLERAGLAEQVEEGMAKPVRVVQRLDRFDLLEEAEIELTSDVARAIHRFSSKAVSDFSHKNPGWLLARSRTVAGKPAVEIDLRVALQQLLEDDPWLSEPADDELRAAIKDAAQATTPWP